jgi:hypothetical protein
VDFFIISHQRSGSTLLKTLLNENPNIVIPPESHILLEWASCNKKVISEKKFLESLQHKRINNWKKPSISFPTTVNDAFTALLRSQAKEEINGHFIVGDKTPEYIDILPFLVKVFPNSKFIILKRNIFDVILSLEKRGWRGPFLENRIDYWASGIKKMNFLLTNNKNCIEVNYSELTKDTEDTIIRIFNFLNVSYDKNKDFKKFNALQNITKNENEKGIHTSLSSGSISYRSRKHLFPNNEIRYIQNISSYLLNNNKVAYFTLLRYNFLKLIGILIMSLTPKKMVPYFSNIRSLIFKKRFVE